jgi:hypothetical protein
MPPPPERRRSVGFWVAIGLCAVVFIALVGGAVGFLGRSSDGAAPPPPPPSQPPIAPKDPREAPHVTGTFGNRRPVVGRRFSLIVPGQEKDFGCVLHSFALPGHKAKGAYLTECPFLLNEGYKVILIGVGLRNATSSPATYDLRNFVMVARNGGTYGAVNIRSVPGVAAANFIPEHGKLPARGRVQGYVTFDARTGGRPQVPAHLSYLDGKQELTVIFRGKLSGG